jgi:hypothetical protein
MLWHTDQITNEALKRHKLHKTPAPSSEKALFNNESTGFCATYAVKISISYCIQRHY